MNFKIVKTLALATFMAANATLAFAADSETITKSMAFHYDKYPESQYSKKVAVINWDSKEGIERLERTPFKGDFYRLAHHFKPQPNPAACGQAAATVVLSAIYELNNKSFPVILKNGQLRLVIKNILCNIVYLTKAISSIAKLTKF